MNTKHIIGELKKNKTIFKQLLEELEPELVYWKQGDEKWCLLEIICHLGDEEREDFRARVKLTLENSETELTPIDPVGWVKSRNYLKQDFNLKLEEFLTERDNSIAFLSQLENPKWDNFYDHPKFGKMTAKLFFTNWLAHDYLHIRQILRLKFDYLASTTNERLDYAGSW